MGAEYPLGRRLGVLPRKSFRASQIAINPAGLLGHHYVVNGRATKTQLPGASTVRLRRIPSLHENLLLWPGLLIGSTYAKADSTPFTARAPISKWAKEPHWPLL